jgi:hypothetical protein
MNHWPQPPPNNSQKDVQKKASFQQLPHSPPNQDYNHQTGLQRDSFGKARSQPLKIKRGSDPAVGNSRRRSSQLNGEKRPSNTNSRSSRDKQLPFAVPHRRSSNDQPPTLKRSRSSTDLDKDKLNHGKARHWSKNLGLGSTNEQLEEAFVTRHMLYKEAMYTGYEQNNYYLTHIRTCIFIFITIYK